jgi:mannitol/fructose-specific phosphotransferase system IIA component
MSNANNSHNEITTINNTNAGMGRSASSARFQIAKVSNNDTNSGTSLGKAISIPHSMLIKNRNKIINNLFQVYHQPFNIHQFQLLNK